MINAKRENNVPNRGVDLRAVDLVIETAVEYDSVPTK